jgi:hypothetical protein
MRHAQLNQKDLTNTDLRERLLTNAINNSKYFEVIQTFLQEFTFKNILILSMDELINGDGVLSVCDFLGISKDYNLPLNKVNFTFERKVKPSWFKYYGKYQFLIFKLPFSKTLRKLGKIVMNANQNYKKLEFTQLSNSEHDMILDALSSDRELFIKSFGIDYFKLVK